MLFAASPAVTRTSAHTLGRRVRTRSTTHHHYNLQRHSLCISINPVRPQAWRGFSLLLADFATHSRACFGPFTPVFPLSFSALCKRANGQVRKAEFFKINTLRIMAIPDLFSNIGRQIKNSKRKMPPKSAQQAVLCLHAPWRRHRQHALLGLTVRLNDAFAPAGHLG